MSADYTRITPRSRMDYRELISEVSESVWPEFIHHDAIAADHWDGLFEEFSAYQFALIDPVTKAVAGIANSVPLAWEHTLQELPDEGWDWALTTSASGSSAGKIPNMMCAIQISVAPSFQRKGVSSILLSEMIELARTSGFQRLIAPVRPSLKDRYPLSSIDSYIKWTREDGLPYDPWLRVHVRTGGRIIKPCPSAMRITGAVAEWQDWTQLHFYESGDYIVPGALVPVTIDLAEDMGIYVEPNVWIVHEIPHD
jgi:GNAT superfamily N-acetyltransferase